MKYLIAGICLLAVALPSVAEQGPGAMHPPDARPDPGTMPMPAEPPAQAPAHEMPADHAGMPEPAAPLEEQAGFSRGSVTRSAFTTVIEDREPKEDLNTVDTATPRVMYFTELRDMEGQTATHRWEYNGEVMAEVQFQVRGPRWRVWSSKSFVPGWTGKWKVSVLNGAGEVISEDELAYVAAPEAPPAEAPTEAAPAEAPMATPETAPAVGGEVTPESAPAN